MQLLGIQLRTPDMPALLVTGFVGLIVCGVTVALVIAGVSTVLNGVSIATGMIGGSLANAYGASVKKYGWRGAILSAGFSLSLLLLVRSLMSLA